MILLIIDPVAPFARLAQSVERKAVNLLVVGSSPTVGNVLLTTLFLVLRWYIRPNDLEAQMDFCYIILLRLFDHNTVEKKITDAL